MVKTGTDTDIGGSTRRKEGQPRVDPVPSRTSVLLFILGQEGDYFWKVISQIGDSNNKFR